MGRFTRLFVGMFVVTLVSTSCSIESTTQEAVESPPPPKRQFVEPERPVAEVLGVVTAPEDVAPEPTSTPEPIPRPTLTAHRVVVHANGDWIIDGDEIVTVHASPGGDSIGAVAVGVVVSATGAGRVLGDTTWLEIELPDGEMGYVRSGDLRVGHLDPETSDPETPDPETPDPETPDPETPDPGTSDRSDAPTLLATPTGTADEAAPVAGDAPASADATTAPGGPEPSADEGVAPLETFLLAGWDPNQNVYEVNVRSSQIWILLGEELVPHTTVPDGHMISVLSDQGIVVADMPLVSIRSRGMDGWIDVRTLKTIGG